jgi:hypothetical protein
MPSLTSVYESLGTPSGRQLRFAALRQGLATSAKDADEFVKAQTERQLLAPRPKSDGVTASLGPGQEYQADLIDYKNFGQQTSSRVVLAVLDPNNRLLRLEALPNKRPATVAAGFRKILQRMPTPKALSTDVGQEFKTHFETMLKELSIIHKFKGSINSLARLDAGIAQIKKQISRLMIRKGGKMDAALIAQAEKNYNETLHGALGTTPNDAAKNDEAGKIVQFQLQKENAEAFQQNHEQNTKKTEALKEAGAFRQTLGRTAFERGDKPKHGVLKEVSTVERGQVTDTAGKTTAIKEVMVVPVATVDRETPDSRGRGLRDARLKEDLKDFAQDLYDAMGDEPIAATAAARLMGPEFARAKPSSLLFTQFVALFPNLFSVTGEGPAKRVKRIGRRLRGKQAL